MPSSAIDFMWACTNTLQYFYMSDLDGVTLQQLRVITKRLSQMPQLYRFEIKIKSLLEKTSTGASLSKVFNRLFASKNTAAEKEQTKDLSVRWIEPIGEIE